jgi:uncharacterized protein
MDEFEWDADKVLRNLAEHRVSFEAARLVFDDVFAVDRHDYRGDPVEGRYVATGMANGILLTVVYTERSNRIRIISARKATRREQEEYHRS